MNGWMYIVLLYFFYQKIYIEMCTVFVIEFGIDVDNGFVLTYVHWIFTQKPTIH